MVYVIVIKLVLNKFTISVDKLNISDIKLKNLF